MFLLFYTMLAAAASAYAVIRLLHPTRIPVWGKALAGVVCFALFELTPASIVLRIAGVENGWTDLLAWTGYVAAGFLSVLLTFLLIRDFAWSLPAAFFRLVKRLGKPWAGSPSEATLEDPVRRHFLARGANAGIAAAAAAFTGFGVAEARRMPAIRKVAVPLAGLPEGLDGFRMVQITDIHVSPTIKRSFVEGVVRRVNALEADIVALTGDLVDGSVQRLSGDVEPLADIRARFGRYFVTGNHEYYSGVARWVEKVESLGFTVLLNEHRLLSFPGGRILVAGVTDYRAGSRVPGHRSDPHKALSGAPPADVKILLAHQPKSAPAASDAGFDFQISGHTHGGQFFPWNLVVGLVQPFTAGLHRYGKMPIYISRGTGYWGPPLRIGAPSEITLITLRAA